MKKFLSIALLLLVALVVFAACANREEENGNGNGDTVATTTTAPAGEGDEPVAAPPSATAHSQGVTDTTIRVGNTAPVSGALAGVGGPFVAGMEAYFAIVNEAGGVNGRIIEFVHHDDGFDAPTGMAMTEQLIHDDRVFALVGHFGTPTISATLPMIF